MDWSDRRGEDVNRKEGPFREIDEISEFPSSTKAGSSADALAGVDRRLDMRA